MDRNLAEAKSVSSELEKLEQGLANKYGSTIGSKPNLPAMMVPGITSELHKLGLLSRKDEASQATPSRAEPGRAELGRTEPSRARPRKRQPGHPWTKR